MKFSNHERPERGKQSQPIPPSDEPPQQPPTPKKKPDHQPKLPPTPIAKQPEIFVNREPQSVVLFMGKPIAPPYPRDVILETMDYTLFMFLEGNRDIKRSNVDKIKKSITGKDLKSVATVNEKFGVIDGQHTVLSRQELNLPIFFCNKRRVHSRGCSTGKC